ncbi:hypothetical protein L3Q82_007896 [Scortum barcoo]|uniref:Uncharacterized protein n=1 Tax=Scortum barcoo TaxID=214431 RepID=A0ACB8WKQ8_9TELE|nr:hypothetical protein L3Q82_007896 [Scortum barcoo]
MGKPVFSPPVRAEFILGRRFTDTCSPCEKIQTKDDVGKLIFKQTADDDKLALSGEDQIFLDIMNREFHKDEANNIRLHEISSNSSTITSAFPDEDLATGLQGLDLGQNVPSMQRTLGLGWDLSTDLLMFQITTSEKPFTKHGVLSVINSNQQLFDPLGVAVPISIEGHAILRDISSYVCDWDEQLPKKRQDMWERWKDSLKHLQQLSIPRMYTSIPSSTAQQKEMIVFCGASIKAVGAVAYLKLTNADGYSEVGFLLLQNQTPPFQDWSSALQ